MGVLGTAVWLVVSVAGLATAAPSDGAAELRVKQTPDEVRRFWTEERMKQALKNPMSPLRDGEASAKRSVPALDEIKLSPPSGPASGAVWTPMSLLRDGQPDAKIACPVTKYESFFDTDNRSYPQRVIGVLFFQDSAGDNFVCSASLINKRLLLTAGHCVASGSGEWHQNFMWAPGYLNGERPFGEAFAEQVLTFPDWFNNHSFPFDVAFMLLTEARGDELGWLGFMTGGAPNSKGWRQNGYPAAPPYDGSKLTVNVSNYGVRDCSSGNPCTVAVGSPLTGGSSGGPWIFQRDGDGYANGLNSYGYRNCNQNMYSPYFGAEVWSLFQDAVGRQTLLSAAPARAGSPSSARLPHFDSAAAARILSDMSR